MKIATPYAKMVGIAGGNPSGRSLVDGLPEFNSADGIALLKHVEWCARISHRSEEATTADSYKRFVQAVVLQHGDWSVVEHASVSVDFYVDRGITHEIVRHRLFAFTQESTRFVNYEKKMLPNFVEPFQHPFENLQAAGAWTEAIQSAEQSYKKMIAAGVAPQIARSVFPNALASRIVVSGNLRNWRHFFLMRTSKEAHPQMREVTIPLLAEFKSKIPILYEDIEPEARQVDNLKKGR